MGHTFPAEHAVRSYSLTAHEVHIASGNWRSVIAALESWPFSTGLRCVSRAQEMKGHLDYVHVCAAQQTICTDATETALDKYLKLIDATLRRLDNGEDAIGSLKSLLKQAQSENIVRAVINATKDYHEAVKVLGKEVDAAQAVDVDAAARKERLPSDALLKVIVDHLYREGLFEVGDILSKEAHVEDSQAKLIFSDMHRLLSQVVNGELHGALEWAVANRSKLSNLGLPTKLEFKLRRLCYLNKLANEGTAEALEYARTHFAVFQDTFMPEIKQLMCCLLFSSRAITDTPYRSLETKQLHADVTAEFVKEACGLLGQACESPLMVAAAAGAVALPQLVKLSVVSKANARFAQPDMELATCTHMPIELELGSEFNFHSIFACPVSKEMTDDENTPMLLPCGHVLSLHSINNIANPQGHNRFKCPYCPEETETRFCIKLHFPDVI